MGELLLYHACNIVSRVSCQTRYWSWKGLTWSNHGIEQIDETEWRSQSQGNHKRELWEIFFGTFTSLSSSLLPSLKIPSTLNQVLKSGWSAYSNASLAHLLAHIFSSLKKRLTEVTTRRDWTDFCQGDCPAVTVETDRLQAFKELHESYSTTSVVGRLIDEILILGSQMQCFSWSFDRKKKWE